MDVMERRKIVIHIGCIQDSRLDGVSVVVPQHVINQEKYANVIFINVNNVIIPSIDCQVEFHSGTIINGLTQPFNNPDIVVFHEMYRRQYIRIAKELAQRNIPYVIVPHGELNRDAQKRKWLKKTVANCMFFRKMANKAAGIQCLSQRELNNTVLGLRKFVATNGINVPETRKKNYKNDNYELVYIGRLDTYHKGIDLMIKAFAKYAKGNLKVRLNIYGPIDAKNKNIINHLINESNCKNSINLHDAVTGNIKESILIGASAFIQTSRFEGMPMGILEALSYGVPCIVTEGTTLGDFIKEKECGISCSNNIESICDGIGKYFENLSKHKIMGDNARKAVIDYYAWDTVAKDTLSKYEEMVSLPKHFEFNSIPTANP